MRPPGFRAQPLSCATPARGSASLMTWDFAQRLRQTSRPLRCSPVRTWEPFRFGVAVLISDSLLCLLLCPGDCGLLEAPLVPQCQPWHRPPLRAGAQKTAAAWSRNEADCASGCKWLWAHPHHRDSCSQQHPWRQDASSQGGDWGHQICLF